jgi:hypothetical protein
MEPYISSSSCREEEEECGMKMDIHAKSKNPVHIKQN